jgi:hypothetical protein
LIPEENVVSEFVSNTRGIKNKTAVIRWIISKSNIK